MPKLVPSEVAMQEVLTFCPVDTTLAVIGGKWKPLILYQLRSGPKRFNELRRLLPTVTQRMLTAHLRELEGDGIVHREIFPVIPPRVEYTLTERGQTLVPILVAMAEWGTAHAAPPEENSAAIGGEGG
ncbi:MAG: helix-turn-helix domain-containing protein [Beijerinckiaceae bacterium]|nr:helix-turn-helix domain-containing protein [Beijerinckiaceae bacterium]MCZ8301793.1 helix-turn-helix domain-containing protein [Beijerinckiaceae bacterium]